MKPFSLSIHIFRNDLRLFDNTALIAALEQSEQVLPVFILDQAQTPDSNGFCFLMSSLKELNEELKLKGSQLNIFKGNTTGVIAELLQEYPVEAIFINRCYAPSDLQQDEAIANVCMSRNVKVFAYADALLSEPELVRKPDGTPYTIFTPFFNKAKQLSVSQPRVNEYRNYFSGEISLQNSEKIQPGFFTPTNTSLRLNGGRKEGEFLLKSIDNLSDYEETRNIPSIKGTSLLSAHHRFGTVSIRETYCQIADTFNEEHPLIRELYWRDFFTHIGFHFPHVFGDAFKEKYQQFEWVTSEENFSRWCTGTTGFPIVDAGMRELITTGFMHNRVRMVVASFLVKDLHIDWRLGERFFATHLLDYDPAVNNGNWQWAASTGCDAQPYFRIFNPWSQQQKFDPECIYIKKWVPELRIYSPKAIHKMAETPLLNSAYVQPIIKHEEEAHYSKMLFSKQV